MKLLKEDVETFDIKEELNEKGEKDFYLEGIFLQANKKNRNGRIYPMEVMKPEVDRYIQTYVDSGRALGEMGHPSGHGQTPNINLERVSHKIEKIWQEGDYFCARAKILDTPYGRIVKELIKEGCQLGVSSRALGSVQRRGGIDYVGHDFRLITAGDIVWEPSAQAAFPKGIMEDLEWEYDETTGEFVQKEISESVDLKKLSTLQIEAFKTFLNQIKSR